MRKARHVDALAAIVGLRALRQASAAAAAGAAARATHNADQALILAETELTRIGEAFEQALASPSRFDPQLAGAWAASWREQADLVARQHAECASVREQERAHRDDWNVQLTLEAAAVARLRRARRSLAQMRDDALLADLAEQAGKDSR
jgi:hypothetical protein